MNPKPANDTRAGLEPPPPWWTDHSEIARLICWLDERGELTDIRDAAYLVEKPWKWTAEYEAMCEGQSEGPGLARADSDAGLEPLLEASLAVVRGAKGGR